MGEGDVKLMCHCGVRKRKYRVPENPCIWYGLDLCGRSAGTGAGVLWSTGARPREGGKSGRQTDKAGNDRSSY